MELRFWTLPVSFGGDTKSRQSLLCGVDLEKDNSKIDPVHRGLYIIKIIMIHTVLKNMSVHSIGIRRRRHRLHASVATWSCTKMAHSSQTGDIPFSHAVQSHLPPPSFPALLFPLPSFLTNLPLFSSHFVCIIVTFHMYIYTKIYLFMSESVRLIFINRFLFRFYVKHSENVCQLEYTYCFCMRVQGKPFFF